jgi:hypothetical protein
MIFYIYNMFIAPSSILLPILIGAIKYRSLDRSLKIILLFNIITGVLNLINHVLATHLISNLFIFHFYAIFEFAIISWFYNIQFKGIINKIIPPLVGIFSILCLVNFFYIQNNIKIELNTYTRSLEGIVIIGYSVMFFNRQSQVDTQHTWGESSLNWANSSFLVFYSCSFFTFMVTNYFLHLDSRILNTIWGVYDAALIAENVLFAIAFLKCRQQPIISSS